MGFYSDKFSLKKTGVMNPVFPLFESVVPTVVRTRVRGTLDATAIIRISPTGVINNRLLTINGKTLYYAGVCRITTGGEIIAFRTNRVTEQISIRIGSPTSSPVTLIGGEIINLPATINDIYFSWGNSTVFNSNYYAVFYVYEDTLGVTTRPFTPFYTINSDGFNEEVLVSVTVGGGGNDNKLQVINNFGEDTSGILRTVVSFSAVGNNTLVAAAGAGIKIKVLGMFLFSAVATNIIIQTGAGGTDIIGQCNLAANQGFVLPCVMRGFHWCETAVNTLLNCNSSMASQIGGVIIHVNDNL